MLRCRSVGGGEGAGGLKMSVAWKMAVVHGILIEGATLGSGASGRGRCGSEDDGIVEAIKGAAGGGCAEIANEVNGVCDEVAEIADEVGGSPV